MRSRLKSACSFGDWEARARAFRQSRSDGKVVAQHWAELVRSYARLSPVCAGVLLGAERVALDGNAAHAVFLRRSIRGALAKNTEVRAVLARVSDRLGIELTLSFDDADLRAIVEQKED